MLTPPAVQAQPDAATLGWASRISTEWAKSVASIIETGRLLVLAKAELAHGQFEAMVDRDLPFGPSTARRLMAIGTDARLTDRAHAHVLPPSWPTLYELTKWDDGKFAAALEAGTIRPDMERRDAIKGARALVADRQEPADSLDFFPTPPWATRALMEHVFPYLGLEPSQWRAWEPACGEGHIAGVLREYFPRVLATDIHNYGTEHQNATLDFLEADGFHHTSHGQVHHFLITNPPFGDKALRFTLRMLELALVGVATFCQLRYLEGIDRYEQVYLPTPPTIVAPFVERVPLHRGRWVHDGGTATAYCWMVWVEGMEPQPMFWIPPGCRTRLSRPDDQTRFRAYEDDQ